MIIFFLVSAVEDYLKSDFVALLKYAKSRDKAWRNFRLQGDQLARVASNELSVEQVAAETMSFQRISVACKHFQLSEENIDLVGSLRRPFRRRKKNLYDLLEELVVVRNNFVHRAELDHRFSTEEVSDIIYDIEVAMTRVNREIFNKSGWPMIHKTWSIGKKVSTARNRINSEVILRK